MTTEARNRGPILVINPNSSEIVTQGLRDALKGFGLPGTPVIECIGIDQGPPGILTQRHVDEAALHTAAVIEARPDARAYVLACYSQPGLDLARSITDKPVYGIQDAGVLTALTLADLFGVIAVAEGSIPRHLRNLRRLGVIDRLAGEIALEGDVSVEGSGHGESSYGLLLQAGRKLRTMGAGVVVLGCAGMSNHRKRLEKELLLPIVDPTQAAVAMAFGNLVTGDL